jgi:fucose permease
MGLTVLETVANPYTTVLGPKEYGASRINLAQSCNGVGWILGPIVGSAYFYSDGGVQKAHGQLFIPYLGVAIVVIILAALFFRAPVPDIHVADEYHTDDNAPVKAPQNAFLVFLMMLLNVAAVGLSVYLILHTILPACGITEKTVEAKWWLFAIPVLVIVPILFASAKKMSGHSIWSHPHFSGATVTQFVYVAGQAGIFSFFINSMTVDKHNGYCMVPALAASWENSSLKKWNWLEHRVALAAEDLVDVQTLAERLREKADPVAAFLASQLSAPTAALLAEYKGHGAETKALQTALLSDLNRILRQELNQDKTKLKPEELKPALYDAPRFSGVTLSATTEALLQENPQKDNARIRLNRLLLQDAFPGEIAYDDRKFALSDKGAGNLSSFAFGLFLLGRLFGAWIMKKSPAHKTLGWFALMNVGACALVVAGLGWVSVACVFLSYFFMSIMFPTIFALGIFGLGSQSKKKAAAFIVMSITGGALMPKFMGHLGDVYNMSTAFWMPLICFILIVIYGFSWPKLSRSEGVSGLKPGGGH